MQLFIIGPEDGGEGSYVLVSAEGEPLASHFCSHSGFAYDDLVGRRTERQEAWWARFGDYTVNWAGDVGMPSRSAMLQRFADWRAAHPEPIDLTNHWSITIETD